jgi:hypothetical protein
MFAVDGDLMLVILLVRKTSTLQNRLTRARNYVLPPFFSPAKIRDIQHNGNTIGKAGALPSTTFSLHPFLSVKFKSRKHTALQELAVDFHPMISGPSLRCVCAYPLQDC